MAANEDVIRRRWPDATSFYRERDHRTDLEVSNLYKYVFTPVEIWIDPDAANDVTVQRIALTAANLTARWARNVTVVVPSVDLTVPGTITGTLAKRLLREMRGADPFGCFRVLHTLSAADSHSALRLHIGPNQTNEVHADDYVVDASGWKARGRRGSDSMFGTRRRATTPAAALAGAIGAGDLFKRAIQHPRSAWLTRFEWSTWSHHFGVDLDQIDEPANPEIADVGNILLAGVGAIGSALLYVLCLAPMRGRFTVVDRDEVDTSNLNRSPLFMAIDAARLRKKTEVAGEFLRDRGLSVREVCGAWCEVGETLSREIFDVWVSLTNEDAAWAAVPYQLPPVVLHGTTTSGWGVAFGRHIPRLEDCTLCRLPRPAAEFRGPCAQGDITTRVQVDSPRASLPFLSTVAAALIAAELMKLKMPEVLELPNAIEGDFRYGLPTVLRMFREATLGCPGCAMAKDDLWLKRGGRGRYAYLSAQRELMLR
jgi:ThiF family protein